MFNVTLSFVEPVFVSYSSTIWPYRVVSKIVSFIFPRKGMQWQEPQTTNVMILFPFLSISHYHFHKVHPSMYSSKTRTWQHTLNFIPSLIPSSAPQQERTHVVTSARPRSPSPTHSQMHICFLTHLGNSQTSEMPKNSWRRNQCWSKSELGDIDKENPRASDNAMSLQKNCCVHGLFILRTKWATRKV